MNRLLLLLLIFPSICSSQNWAPIHPSDIYNYQEATDNYITTSIRIDSFTVDQQDTIYHFNRIIKDCEGCSFTVEDSVLLVNQEDFLSRSVVQQADGMFVFSGNTNFQINPYADLDDTWIFDVANNVSATVIQIEETTLFDQTDSCKFILLSTNDTIKLSKNFGLIDFNYQDKHYALTGIQTRELGETVPTWMEYHDFEVGDVFQYRNRSFSFANIRRGVNKRTILDKVETVTEIIYTVHSIQSDTLEDPIINNTEYFQSENTIELTININGNFPFMTNYNNQFVFTEESFFGCLDGDDKFMVRPLYLHKNELDQRINLGTGQLTFDLNQEIEPTYLHILGSDTIVQERCFDEFYFVYTTGLGKVFEAAEVIDSGFETRLIGYIKDGDTTGVITPDPILLDTDNTLASELTNFEIQPNPVQEIASIYFKNETPTNLQVLDINGRLIKEVAVSNNLEMMDLDLGNLTTGLYLIKAQYGNFERVQKMVKW